LDVLVAVAASGQTPYTLGVLRGAKAQGALTVALANNPGAPLLLEAHHPVLLDTGPEPIAGSTRLGAGTAQKAALNLFSTTLMVRLGRVYGNRMLRMRATNRKLKERGARMLKELDLRGAEDPR
jgi:N-acetylmuramic acid 6-phosphate etherase